jgi:hypothetical protein
MKVQLADLRVTVDASRERVFQRFASIAEGPPPEGEEESSR